MEALIAGRLNFFTFFRVTGRGATENDYLEERMRKRMTLVFFICLLSGAGVTKCHWQEIVRGESKFSDSGIVTHLSSATKDVHTYQPDDPEWGCRFMSQGMYCGGPNAGDCGWSGYEDWYGCGIDYGPPGEPSPSYGCCGGVLI